MGTALNTASIAQYILIHDPYLYVKKRLKDLPRFIIDRDAKVAVNLSDFYAGVKYKFLWVSDGQFFNIRVQGVDQVVEFFPDDGAGYLKKDGLLFQSPFGADDPG